MMLWRVHIFGNNSVTVFGVRVKISDHFYIGFVLYFVYSQTSTDHVLSVLSTPDRVKKIRLASIYLQISLLYKSCKVPTLEPMHAAYFIRANDARLRRRRSFKSGLLHLYRYKKHV